MQETCLLIQSTVLRAASLYFHRGLRKCFADDYELLFTSAPEHKEKIKKIAKVHDLKVTNIGYVKIGNNGQVTSNNRPINIDAYKHF